MATTATSTTTTTTGAAPVPRPARPPGQRMRHLRQMNWLGGLAGWLWLAIVIIPIYWIVITSFKGQDTYFSGNPMAPPTSPTTENYRFVLDSGFARYFVNSVIVTIGAIVPALFISFMASYAIVRGAAHRHLQFINGTFLMGLAIPIQATIIPVYLIII